MQLLPAGVPKGLLQLKARISHILGDAPIGFIGAVLAIAIVFRLGIGVMKPASAEPEVQAPVALHTPPEAPKATKAEAKPAAAPIVTDALPTIEPAPVVTATAKKRNKAPRSFGKR